MKFKNRTTLADRQSKVEILSSNLTQIDHEVQLYKEMIASKFQEYEKQKEVIDSILYLCKGDNNNFYNDGNGGSNNNGSQALQLTSASTDRRMDLITEKISLLSTLEKYNEDTIASNVYRQKEKFKYEESIQEGLEIGKKYKAILESLQEEENELEAERRVAETCLNDCKVKLEQTMIRVREKVIIVSSKFYDNNIYVLIYHLYFQV